MNFKELIKEYWFPIVMTIVIVGFTFTIIYSLGDFIDYIKINGLQAIWYGIAE